jgi:hypothetical protein
LKKIYHRKVPQILIARFDVNRQMDELNTNFLPIYLLIVNMFPGYIFCAKFKENISRESASNIDCKI